MTFSIWAYLPSSSLLKVRNNLPLDLKRSNSLSIVTKVPVQTSDAQKSYQYKRRTSTNVWQVQTSDQYKRRTGTNVVRVHLWEKTSDLVDFEWTIVLKISNYEFYKIIQFNRYIFATRCCRCFQEQFVDLLLYFQSFL